MENNVLFRKSCEIMHRLRRRDVEIGNAQYTIHQAIFVLEISAEIDGIVLLFQHMFDDRKTERARLIPWHDLQLLRYQDIHVYEDIFSPLGEIQVYVKIGNGSFFNIKGHGIEFEASDHERKISILGMLIKMKQIDILKHHYIRCVDALKDRGIVERDAIEDGKKEDQSILELKKMSEMLIQMELERRKREDALAEENRARKEEEEKNKKEMYGVIPAAKNALAIVQGKKPKERRKIQWRELGRRISSTVANEAKDIAARAISHIASGSK